MKYVQILIESPMLKEYLRTKLVENGIETIIPATPMESIAKMRTHAPDLVILDFSIGKQSLIEVLKKKKADVNTVNTPVIILAEAIEQRQLVELSAYNVKKVFTKPIKIDALFANLSELIGIKFKVDNTPSIVEVNVNEDIIFIEVANGFNRDKIELLRFKIAELLLLYRIRIPRVIIMFSNIKCSRANELHLHAILQVVIESSRAALHYIKILTNDDYIREFMEKEKDYSRIKTVSSLQSAIDLLFENEGAPENKEEMAELISSQLLKAKTNKETEEMSLKFYAEKGNFDMENIMDSMKGIRIGVIDDDFIIQEQIKNTFEKTGAIVNVFSDGEEFFAIVDTWDFDLVFVDLNMPIVGGFEVLRVLQRKNKQYPAVILSTVSTRDAMIQAIQMGVKSYIVKPLKPDDILKKTFEILKTNF